MRKYILILLLSLIGAQSVECANKRPRSEAAEDLLRAFGDSPHEDSTKPGGKAPGTGDGSSRESFGEIDGTALGYKFLEDAAKEGNQIAFDFAFKTLLKITPGEGCDQRIELLQAQLFGSKGMPKEMIRFFRCYFEAQEKVKQAILEQNKRAALAHDRANRASSQTLGISDEEFEELIEVYD